MVFQSVNVVDYPSLRKLLCSRFGVDRSTLKTKLDLVEMRGYEVTKVVT
jgi:hypothetical protein